MIDAKLFIGGQWLPGAGRFPVVDKYTGELIAEEAKRISGEMVPIDAVNATTWCDDRGAPERNPL